MSVLLVVSLLSYFLVALAQDQVILVGSNPAAPGGGALQFIPHNVTAKAGSVITFQFSGVPGNHSVTQSSFEEPCTPLEGGFDTGFIQVLQPVYNAPEWNLTIMDDTQPIWFFCKQLSHSHCTSGMVGSINPSIDGEGKFEEFRANAELYNGTIGQEEGSLVGIGASASAIPYPLESGVSTFGVPGKAVETQSASG